jgi:hypothetical protein
VALNPPYSSQTLAARVAEWKTGRNGPEINIQHDKNENDDENGEDELARRCHDLFRNRFVAITSHPLDKTIHHAFLAGAVELDRQLVAVDRGDVAVAEFLVKDAVAE